MFAVVFAIACDRDGGSIQTSHRSTPGSTPRTLVTSPSARVSLSAEDNLGVLAVVFRRLFDDRRYSVQGRGAKLFFVGVGHRAALRDPDTDLLHRLASSDWRVLPQSMSTFDVARGVRHKDTDELGLLFYARIIAVDGDDVILRSGYVEHGKSGIEYLMVVSQPDGSSWRVMEAVRTSVS